MEEKEVKRLKDHSSRMTVLAVFGVVLGLLALIVAGHVNGKIPQREVTIREYRNLLALNEKVALFEKKIKGLDGGIASINIINEAKHRIILNPAKPGSGYQTLYTRSGMFLISIKDVEPYLNGVRVHLNIGNPMSASYNGAILDVSYGANYIDYQCPEIGEYEYISEYFKAEKKWRDVALKKEEVNIMSKIESGRWNSVSFVLAPVDPKKIFFIGISMTTDNLSLKAPLPESGS